MHLLANALEARESVRKYVSQIRHNFHFFFAGGKVEANHLEVEVAPNPTLLTVHTLFHARSEVIGYFLVITTFSAKINVELTIVIVNISFYIVCLVQLCSINITVILKQ